MALPVCICACVCVCACECAYMFKAGVDIVYWQAACWCARRVERVEEGGWRERVDEEGGMRLQCVCVCSSPN